MAIRTATVDDAALVARFGAEVFDQTFGAENRPEDMATYLASAFSPEKQRQEIAYPSARMLLMEVGAELIGYAYLRQGPMPDAVRDRGAIELVRFYVDRAWHGRGVARTLMTASLEAVGGRERTVWLGVWERNARAIAFYGKCGFADVGAHTFVLGTDVQTDRLMVRAKTGSAPPPGGA